MTTLYRQITFLVGKSLDNKTLGQVNSGHFSRYKNKKTYS